MCNIYNWTLASKQSLSPFYLSASVLILCVSIFLVWVLLFNLIESQTRLINSWINQYAYWWFNSKVNDNHDTTTKKCVSPTWNWTIVPCNLSQCATNELCLKLIFISRYACMALFFYKYFNNIACSCIIGSCHYLILPITIQVLKYVCLLSQLLFW